LQAIRHEVRRGAPGGETQPRFRRVGTMDRKGCQPGYRFQIMIQRLVCLPALAATTQQADGYHSPGVQRQPNRSFVRVGLAID